MSRSPRRLRVRFFPSLSLRTSKKATVNLKIKFSIILKIYVKEHVVNSIKLKEIYKGIKLRQGLQRYPTAGKSRRVIRNG